MFRRVLQWSLATLVVVLPTVAAAQQTRAAMLKGNDTTVDTFDATVLAAQRQTNRRPQARDSLLNGAIFGGFVGGVSGAVGTLVVQEAICSDCDVERNDVVTATVLGAAIGAGIGTAIDALKDRHRGAATRRGPFDLSPILGRGRRGILAWVRF